MNVGQLKALLSEIPDDLDVFVEGYENGFDPLCSLTLKSVTKVLNPADYDGLYDIPNNLVPAIPEVAVQGMDTYALKRGSDHLVCLVIEGLRGHRRQTPSPPRL